MKYQQNQLPYEWLDEIIKTVEKWLVVVDLEGLISYINPGYCEFLGVSAEDVLGKPVQDVIENTRMHIVVKTGIAEVADVQRIKGNDMIANRYPLHVAGTLVGAVGTVSFRNVQEWMEVSRKIQSLMEDLQFYKAEFEKRLSGKYTFADLVGRHPKFLEAKRLAERVAASQSAVLLTGESGTGKELFAHAIHRASHRAGGPFVRVNCAAIPDNLLESELFGYEEGAFTGAKRGGKKGRFELAHRGTIFLDEIGDMPVAMQTKLLRVLQEKEIERVGGQTPISINVRIIAATHRDLETMIQEGSFRQDLYYRLNVMRIEIPPLRERKEDILPLALALLKKMECRFYRRGLKIAPEVEERLMAHTWPGNARELENVLERAINVLDGEVIHLEHLPLYLRDGWEKMETEKESEDYYRNEKGQPVPAPVTFDDPVINPAGCCRPLRETVAEAERTAILQALKATKGDKLAASRLLGIGKTTFYDKCKFYEID